MPTLSNGQIVIAHQIRNFKVGQVVIAHVDGREVVKRIQEIKKGSVFLLGDNEKHSTDSRVYGYISDVNIEGIVFWPRNISDSK
jgi:phage repressor protein C with HTH and peptisase S24 domain